MLVRPIATVVLCLAIFGGQSAFAETSQQKSMESSQEVPGVQAAEAATFMQDLGQLVQQLNLHDYLAAIEASNAAEQAARSAMASPSSYSPVSNNGMHSDAWWQGVSICEQGGRNDPYFGYFSWMDGSAAGLTWDQQVAKSNALLASVGHEVGPWAASCVAAGYAASPSG